MATLTYDPTPADQPEFRESEVEAFQRGEQQAAAEQGLLAGKFRSQEDLEQAYLELQQKLGGPRDEVQTSYEGEEEDASEEDLEYDDEYDDEDDGDYLTEEQAVQLQNLCGGPQAYSDMIKWAGQNLSENEIDMFDGVVGTGDPGSCYYAIQNLFSRYQDAVGAEGTMLTGQGAVDKQDVFRSQQEVVAAMSDPRYDRDPAYRQDVFTKLERSQIQY